MSASLLPYCRTTVVVGKHGHTVVDRNRLRRRLKELARLQVLPECHGVDVVIRALPAAYDISFKELEREMKELRKQFLGPG